MKKKSVDNIEKYKGALTFIIIGLGVISIALIMEERHINGLPLVSIKLASEIGIALVSAGLIGIRIETKHWAEYFTQRLKDIVVSDEFVNNLDLEQVELLHENVFAKKYGESIKNKNSLYNFFKSKALADLELPYREDFSLNLNITNEADKLKYEEVLSYKCRADRINNKIQDVIIWSYDINDIQNATIHSLTLFVEKNNGAIYSYSAFIDEFSIYTEDEFCVWTYPIPYEFRHDNLKITLKSTYEGDLGRLWGVILSYPLKNISNLTFNYPEDLHHQMVYFGIDEHKFDRHEKKPGKYVAQYSDWCLKQYGFALQLSKKKAS